MKVKKIFNLIGDLVFFLAGSLLILVFAYRFGWLVLRGPVSWGNDFPFALSYVFYLDRWWPHLPLWHYEWTGGMPLLENYPFLASYLTFFTHYLTNLTIVQIARFCLWFSLALAGIGIMILARLMIKNWLAAILAGIFFLLSPGPWLWILQGGFYAATISFPFMVFTFIFWELALKKEKRVWLFLAALFLGLTWITHPKTAIAASLALGVYGLGYGLMVKKICRSILKAMAAAIGGFLLVAFWTIPFVLSRSGSGPGPDYEAPFITIPQILGLVGPEAGSHIFPGFFSGPIWFLAGLGLVLALIQRRILMVVLTILAGLFLVVGPGYFPKLLQGPLMTIWGAVNVRAIVIPRLFLPILAAYGAFSFGRLAGKILGGGLTLILVLVVFQKIVIIPTNMPEDYFYQGYGPVYPVYEKKLPILPSFRESFESILNLRVDEASIWIATILSEFIKKAGLSDHDRIDISPLSGAIIAAWNTISGVSQVNPYVGASLITPMFGYEQACLHSLDPDCSGLEVQSLAKWWGLKIIYTGMANLTNYQPENDNEALINIKKAGFKEKTVTTGDFLHFCYEVPGATSLATISNKPLVLVIGENPPFNDGFRTVFKSFNRSSWNYDRAMLISGKRFIDDYSLADLKKFPIVVLYGYQVRNKEKTWAMLSKYVEEGGSLFVETGWQYWSQDWGKFNSKGQSETISLVDLLPVSKIKWGEVGIHWQDLQVTGDNLGVDLASKGWADLIWQGKPWGMSLAEPEDLRPSSFPLVITAGKLVAAGRNFGKGKIIWSGINLFSHTAYHQSEAENKFLAAVFSWLITSDNSIEENLDFKRETPDKIVIEIDQSPSGPKSVMFKEVADAGWRVFWQTKEAQLELPILRAGPGWKLVQLPENVDRGKVVMTYQRTFEKWFAIFLSAMTMMGLLVFLTGWFPKGGYNKFKKWLSEE